MCRRCEAAVERRAGCWMDSVGRVVLLHAVLLSEVTGGTLLGACRSFESN